MGNGSEDGAGWIFIVIALIGGAYWFHKNYEIAPKKDHDPVAAATQPAIPRPTGMLELTESDRWVYRLNADSVRGDRAHRQGWVIIDASKDKSADWRYNHVLYMVDCNTTAIRQLSSLFYDAKGKAPWPPENIAPEKAEPKFYPEGTIGYAPVAGLCYKGYDDNRR